MDYRYRADNHLVCSFDTPKAVQSISQIPPRQQADELISSRTAGLTTAAISNSPQPVSVISYGGWVYSLVGLSKLGCSWKTTCNVRLEFVSVSFAYVKNCQDWTRHTLVSRCVKSSPLTARRYSVHLWEWYSVAYTLLTAQKERA